ncbi:hypothetical protein COV04_02110 [Candidatus Uhrbacteria bacterium CG10_big_fil_rev_8_21_14_0_10_48_11]|uniref:Uncharacterized protein n=1 Tax=Candidatus Uhrbacteria bacterium CG10_big_fil_rev_8_21_14_0_10_48_11 TaxID=1975037 RepID=A0A2M8LEP9_9BACT|nr:MAG: hypothetical protein COV04_02110 [Candidatus Uhrbacteria bacterium CG10_big_fil_rev_8_21_14_0_10_48_11]
MRLKKVLASILVSSFCLLVATPALGTTDPLNQIYDNLRPIGSVYGQSTLLNSQNTQQILIIRVSRIIRVALTLLAIIFVVLMIYAGALWMTARGNQDRVEQAQQTLRNALIGLIIIAASYAATDYLVSKILEGTIG